MKKYIDPKKKKAYELMPDLTRTNERSVAARFEILIQTAEKYRNNLDLLKTDIIAILDDPTTIASKDVRFIYKQIVNKTYEYKHLLSFITSVYFGGAKMKVI
jgi:hypothetical protein